VCSNSAYTWHLFYNHINEWKKMEECVRPFIPAKIYRYFSANQGHNSKKEIDPDLLFMVHDLEENKNGKKSYSGY
jgi:macrodomain Ter protein organizer (MatP/YcbG family)